MTLESSTFVTPLLDGVKMRTRDILHARMSFSNSHIIDFIVNHHPSKYGGEHESEVRRNSAMLCLKHICDSVSGKSIVAMGDFNDTPVGNQFHIIADILKNKGIRLHENNEGSIRYKGKWELIDFFMTGHAVNASQMQVVRIPFLMTYDKRYPGEKPLRTYSGPRYLGGVSDHCPIAIWISPAN
jgi:endonuclease/exonuclease/phosphatase family metal-dependent hydrolase